MDQFIPTKHLVAPSTSRSEWLNVVPSTTGPLLPRIERRGEWQSLGQRQLRVIREMVEDMEAQTMAGQQVTMEKIVAFLRSWIDKGSVVVAPRNGRQLSQMIDQLAGQARRPVPDVHLFGERADALVVLLSAM